MTDSAGEAGQLRIEPLDDGKVAFRVTDSRGNPRLGIRLTSDEISGLATELLTAAHGAQVMAGTPPSPLATEGTVKACPANALLFGFDRTHGQRVIIAQIGQARIALSVQETQLRDLGRSLIKAAQGLPSSSGTWRSLMTTLGDCYSDLQGWTETGTARLVAGIRRWASSIWPWLQGRSFVGIRIVSVEPDIPPPEYSAVGECIYCGSKTYSPPPGREHPLGAEHIIAEGLGGTLKLPQASCQAHEDATGRLVEGDVLGRTLKALRLHLKLSKKGKKKTSPDTLPLDATVKGVGEKRLRIPIDDYPIVFTMPIYPPPIAVANAQHSGKPVVGTVVAMLRYDQALLYKKYNITGCATASWDNLMFCRMLAKIGHAFATAELGLSAFESAHLELIAKGVPDSCSMIGCVSDWDRTKRTLRALHELELGYQRFKGETYVVVRITLFAVRGAPTYVVVVGRSLESRATRLRRSFFRTTGRKAA
jgi:hypothetical protein